MPSFRRFSVGFYHRAQSCTFEEADEQLLNNVFIKKNKSNAHQTYKFMCLSQFLTIEPFSYANYGNKLSR